MEYAELIVIVVSVQVLKVLKVPDGRVFAVAISADGSKIVSGGYKANLYVWSVETGEVNLHSYAFLRYPLNVTKETQQWHVSCGFVLLFVVAFGLCAERLSAALGIVG